MGVAFLGGMTRPGLKGVLSARRYAAGTPGDEGVLRGWGHARKASEGSLKGILNYTEEFQPLTPS